jgi:hypothetical protein
MSPKATDDMLTDPPWTVPEGVFQVHNSVSAPSAVINNASPKHKLSGPDRNRSSGLAYTSTRTLSGWLVHAPSCWRTNSHVPAWDWYRKGEPVPNSETASMPAYQVMLPEPEATSTAVSPAQTVSPTAWSGDEKPCAVTSNAADVSEHPAELVTSKK